MTPRLFLALISMTILFGLSFIATQTAVLNLGIFEVVFLRNVLALSVFVFIFLRNLKKFKIARPDIGSFLLLALIEPVGYFMFETLGIKHTSPANVSLIIATIPIFSAVFSFWFLKEKLTSLMIAGIFLSLVGVYLIVAVQTTNELAPDPVLGSVFTFGAAISAGMYNVFARKLSQKYSPLTITFYQTFVASVVFFPFAAIQYSGQSVRTIESDLVISLIYLGIGCSVGAYLLLNYTLSKLETAKVAVFANLIPVVTILASYLIYSEFLKPIQLGGALLIIIGIYATATKKFATKPPPM